MAVLAAAADAATDDRAEFVGTESCISCHTEQVRAWQGSHHDLAMQHADSDSVLGDFSDATFTYGKVTTTFLRRAGGYFVRTDGADGKLAEFQVRYTFGVSPLQQYLVEFPDGRVQALGVAWDTRPAADGGQRWFHLYPDAQVDHEDELHWTGPQQNWNYQCAECHSTNLTKGYDPQTRTFNTQWSEVNVACEACHGPGSNHVAWANKAEDWEKMTDMGLEIALDARQSNSWQFDGDANSARRILPIAHQNETETCARCHSRRGIQSEDYIHGKAILDTHRVSRLSEGLYYPDGQIRDEVYV